MEQRNKVVKLNEDLLEKEGQVNVDKSGGGEINDNELSEMDQLPTEILMKVLDYLNEQELVKCRLLSSRLNEICCLLLQDKTKNNPQSKLIVHLNNTECKTVIEPIGSTYASKFLFYFKTIVLNGLFSMETMEVFVLPMGSITKSFKEFLDCFAVTEAEKSSGSGRRRPFPFSCFIISSLYFMERNQMTRFVSLFVHMKKIILNVQQEDLRNFGPFWRLLLKFAPKIQHLGLYGNQWFNIELFDPYFFVKANSDPFQTVQTQHDSFLNKLRIFETTPWFTPSFVNPVDNFLENTPNVQKLLGHDPLYLIGVWQRLNRVHLLKKLDISSNSQSNLSPVDLMKNLGLEELCADCCMFSSPVEKTALNYINHAMKSSQNTLSKLNLINLHLECMNFCFKDIKSLPNVRQLQLQIRLATENGSILQRFCALCPNVTSLILDYYLCEFSPVAQILWTGFKGLKSLKLSLNMTDERNNVFLVDSAFSGYPPESIVRILTKLEVDHGISLEEARQNEKQIASISDLKGLSHLELQFLMGLRTEEMKKVEHCIRHSLFRKMLPQHIQEYPRTFSYHYNF